MTFKLAAFADEAAADIKDQIEVLKENNISLLEIRGVDGTNIADISLAKAKEVRSILDNAGISCWSLGSPFGKIGINDDFYSHLESFKRSLDVCEVLGAHHIRLFSFYNAIGHFDEVAKRLDKFVRSAKGYNVILCHENEKDIYGDIASRCLEIHKNFPEIKAVFDPANFIQSGQDTKEAWTLLSPYIEYMHIKDALSDGFVVPAGKGIGNIPILLGEYKGEVLTIEPHLTVFEGFNELEATNRSNIRKYAYSNSVEAFKAAVDALNNLIK